MKGIGPEGSGSNYNIIIASGYLQALVSHNGSEGGGPVRFDSDSASDSEAHGIGHQCQNSEYSNCRLRSITQ